MYPSGILDGQLTMHVRVKICGITNVEDALLAAELGADAIGLNFYPGSPRYVNLQTAEQIVDDLAAFVEPVGVFVNESRNNLEEFSKDLFIRTVQIHGDSTPPCRVGLRWIPAFPVQELADLSSI